MVASKNTATRKKKELQKVSVTLRVPQDIVAQIDQTIERRCVPVSRNTWIIEAAVEKLALNERKSHGAE
jgi:metal-responsive CopG/Arc/MetJ family transcriptional regulator